MKPNCYISTENDQLDIDLIVDYLKNKSYWARDRSEDLIKKSIENSVCFGIYNKADEQVGFARVITDFAVFAWVMDVFILNEYQGKGLGQQLIKEVLSHPKLKHVIKWGLATKDAHAFYKQFGFSFLLNPEEMMERKLTLLKNEGK